MKLYHVPTFRSTRAAWMWFELKSLYGNKVPDCEVIYLSPATFRHEKTQELLDINPNGKVYEQKVPIVYEHFCEVPALVLDHGTMFESCAICLYFLEKFDLENLLAPIDDQFRQNLLTMSFYASGTLDSLTATSSPIQRVLKNPRPGIDYIMK